jgi:hypothetical protein
VSHEGAARSSPAYTTQIFPRLSRSIGLERQLDHDALALKHVIKHAVTQTQGASLMTMPRSVEQEVCLDA